MPAWIALALALADPSRPLQRVVEALVPPGRFAVLVTSLDRGDTLASLEPDRPLPPASTVKLVTAAVAWSFLGPDFRFLTAVVSEPPDATGTVRRLALVGHGDPTLRRADLRALAAAVRAAGLRRVTDDLVADATAWEPFGPPPGWTASDLRQPYGARPAALSVDGNVQGGRPVADAPSAALAAWRAALLAAGVAPPPRAQVRRSPAPSLAPFVDGAAPPAAVRLWALHASPPLDSVLPAMLRESDNLVAEALWVTLGRWIGGRGHPATAAALVREQLARWGVPSAGTEIVDGSGLSRRNRLTARALVHLVAHLDRWLGPATLARWLPSAGDPGSTLAWLRDPALRGRVHAKTGTLHGVVALAGVVETRAGERLAFAFLGHDLPDAATGRRVETALLRALVQFARS